MLFVNLTVLVAPRPSPSMVSPREIVAQAWDPHSGAASPLAPYKAYSAGSHSHTSSVVRVVRVIDVTVVNFCMSRTIPVPAPPSFR